ncbi:MAG: MarR family transcriptional regulator [Longispora sp.]|nr:MarR family transcriptional regulator [Longispora sp. (in: high G+C Gram-positive bacteria)]
MSTSLEACIQLLRVQASVSKRLDGPLSSVHGVSFADFLLLSHLGTAPEHRMRRVDLAQALGLTPSGVTRALGPLERIGLVTREAHPRDARVTYAVLTPTGQERLEEMSATAERISDEILATPPWSTAKVASLVQALTLLGTTATN